MLTYLGYMILGWMMAANLGGPYLTWWAIIFGVDMVVSLVSFMSK